MLVYSVGKRVMLTSFLTIHFLAQMFICRRLDDSGNFTMLLWGGPFELFLVVALLWIENGPLPTLACAGMIFLLALAQVSGGWGFSVRLALT